MFVIFDMDGTLVDSSQTLINAINYVRSKLSLPAMDGKKIMDGILNPHSNMPREFYGIDKIEPIHEEWFKEYYSANHDRELKLFDGVEEMLKKLKENGIKIALATNAYRDSTMQALSHLKIDKYFNDIVCFDEVENGKPAPDMLHLLLERNSVSNRDALFVGDSSRDSLAAKAADIDYLQVAFGQNSKGAIDKPRDLVDIILKRKEENV